MGATNRVSPIGIEWQALKEQAAAAAPALAPRPVPTPVAPVARPDAPTTPERVPTLRVTPLLRPGCPRQFVRIPTHAVGMNHHEQREYPRASLRLPLRLRSINGAAEDFPVTLVTRDISSTGVFFLCPKQIAVGASIELEIVLIPRPMGRGSVVILTQAQAQRIEPAATPGWYGVAASFGDVHFDRDDRIPSRFLQP